MSTKLARPLAARVASLPPAAEPGEAVAIPAQVIAAAQDALDKGKTHYADRPGILPLREWVSAYLLERYKLDIAPDAITITCAETEARFVSIKSLLPAGSLLYCTDASSPIVAVAALAGLEVTHSLDAGNISAAYLTPDSAADIIERCVGHAIHDQWWLIWDTTDTDSQYHPAHNSEAAPRIITIGGIEDQIPGWRIGWLAGSEVAGKLRAYKQSMTICTPSISQWAALGLA